MPLLVVPLFKLTLSLEAGGLGALGGEMRPELRPELGAAAAAEPEGNRRGLFKFKLLEEEFILLLEEFKLLEEEFKLLLEEEFILAEEEAPKFKI